MRKKKISIRRQVPERKREGVREAVTEGVIGGGREAGGKRGGIKTNEDRETPGEGMKGHREMRESEDEGIKFRWMAFL